MSSEYPSLPQQGKNFASFAFEMVKKAMQSQALIVTEEVKESRLNICRSCDKYDPDQHRCKECGCLLEYKATFALDSCPLQKWTESNDAWMNGKFDELLEDLTKSQENC
jgi:hypothetical protein